MAGDSASTNHSDTKAAPTLAPTSTATASHSGHAACPRSPLPSATAGSPRSEKGRLAANTTRSITAQATLSAAGCAAAGVCSHAASVGTASAATASIVSVTVIRGASLAKRWVPFLSPPTSSASPSTSSELARIEPTSAACTTCTSPARSAKMQTNSSGRLPSADCSTPVAPGPMRLPSCSVPCPTIIASSDSAAAHATKPTTGPAPANVTPAATAVAPTASPRLIASPRERVEMVVLPWRGMMGLPGAAISTSAPNAVPQPAPGSRRNSFRRPRHWRIEDVDEKFNRPHR